MDIILSIKPKYVTFIREKKKYVELRKKIPLTPAIEKIFIYESAPVKKIIGYIIPTTIIKLSLDELWEKTKSLSCLPESDFKKYYEGKKEGTAIFFKKFIEGQQIKLQHFFLHAPQNYAYLTVLQTEQIEELLFQ